MVLRKGLPAKNASTDANDTRYDFSALTVCDAAGVPRSGVTSPAGSPLVTATASMAVNVARFQGVAVRDAGVVLLANDGPVSVPIAAAPGANSRIDVIYAKQNDSSSTVTVPDANDLPVFGVLQGTPAAIPVRNPAGLPAGALEIGTIQIPSTATATNSSGVVITQSAQFTAAAGGIVPVRTASELSGLPLKDGLYADVLDTNALMRCDGAAWNAAGIGQWTAYTPTLTNIVVGTGGVSSFIYRREGDEIRVRFVLKFGSAGASIQNLPTFTLPVNSVPLNHPFQTYNGGISYYDNAPGVNYPGVVAAENTSVSTVRLFHTNAGAYGNLGPAAPFSWAADDALQGEFTYRGV